MGRRRLETAGWMSSSLNVEEWFEEIPGVWLPPGEEKVTWKEAGMYPSRMGVL